LRLRRGLADRDEQDAVHKLALGQTLGRLAQLVHATNQPERAIKLASKAIVNETGALRLAPWSAEARRAVRNHYHLLGSLQVSQGRIDLGIEAHAAGNRLASELARDYPDLIEDQFSVGFSHFSLANALLRAGRRDEADAAYRECLSCWQAASASKMHLAPPNTLHDTISCHFDAVQLNGQQAALESYRAAIRQLTNTERYGAWTERIDDIPHNEPDRIYENIENIPHLQRAKPLLAEYVRKFDDVIDALSRNDLTAAHEHLQATTESESELPGSLFELVGNVPIVALYAKSCQFLLGHARALEQLGRMIAESDTS
jgi:tetratricopeptide (TPR) repeat protein